MLLKKWWEAKRRILHGRITIFITPFFDLPKHGLAPAFLRFEQWTPKGDCKEAGNKERN